MHPPELGREEEGLRDGVRADRRERAPEHQRSPPAAPSPDLLAGVGVRGDRTPRRCPEKRGWLRGTSDSLAQTALLHRGDRDLSSVSDGALQPGRVLVSGQALDIWHAVYSLTALCFSGGRTPDPEMPDSNLGLAGLQGWWPVANEACGGECGVYRSGLSVGRLCSSLGPFS